MRRITLQAFFLVNWKEAKLAAGTFVVETIIPVVSVETLTILGNSILPFLKLSTRISESFTIALFEAFRKSLMLSRTNPNSAFLNSSLTRFP